VIVGYCRVSSEAQGEDGYGLDAQADAILRACQGRDWQPRLMREVASAGKASRPVLEQAVQAVEEAGGTLMVARLDRLSRSVGHFAGLLDRAQAKGWTIICLDPAVDMSTPYGRAMAGMASVFAQLERELISQRTKEGLRAAKKRGGGHPPGKVTPELLALAESLVASGMSRRGAARIIGVRHSSLDYHFNKTKLNS
jgi:DNA invertase Pin-like site-specific DNA recombinase